MSRITLPRDPPRGTHFLTLVFVLLNDDTLYSVWIVFQLHKVFSSVIVISFQSEFISDELSCFQFAHMIKKKKKIQFRSGLLNMAVEDAKS